MGYSHGGDSEESPMGRPSVSRRTRGLYFLLGLLSSLSNSCKIIRNYLPALDATEDGLLWPKCVGLRQHDVSPMSPGNNQSLAAQFE
jgi:hypothetical protein